MNTGTLHIVYRRDGAAIVGIVNGDSDSPGETLDLDHALVIQGDQVVSDYPRYEAVPEESAEPLTADERTYLANLWLQRQEAKAENMAERARSEQARADALSNAARAAAEPVINLERHPLRPQGATA